MADTVRYRQYSTHLVEKFGEKVYKLPINVPGTCPNRDGTVGVGGCTFCDETGAGFECLPSSLTIGEQIGENKEFFIRRFNAHKFICYFQAFTNTYLPLEQFKANVLEAVAEPDIVGIAISTRPDCINDQYLDFLSEIQKTTGVDINIELGLQTANYHSLLQINRGHTLAEFVDATLRIKQRGFEICAHIILNLPWDDETDVIENAKLLSALRVDYVKLHSLYFVKNTPMGQMFSRGELQLISLAEYIERVIMFLEYLDPRMVVQRLVGKGPQGDDLIFCNWSTSWWKIKDQIEDDLEARDTWQGKKFDYLNGKALKGLI